MVNTEAWDRIAARRGAARADGVVRYAPGVADEREFRLCGDVDGKRVLDVGCGSGENAIAFARAGAHVIGVDRSVAQLHLGRKAADEAEVRVEWHESDAADLAFLRADSIDLAFAAGVLGEIEDTDRVFRQVHRVLRPGAALVFSYDHPMALAVGREGGGPGALPLGPLEVCRSYFDPGPVTIERDDEPIAVFPRTVAEVFAALHRAGYRVDVIVEAEAVLDAEPGPQVPAVIIWRARKEGV
jgi:SAM-dependent methyltransferase